MDGPNSRTDETEETISDLEDKIEIIQFEKVEKMEKKNEQCLRYLWDYNNKKNEHLCHEDKG